MNRVCFSPRRGFGIGVFGVSVAGAALGALVLPGSLASASIVAQSPSVELLNPAPADARLNMLTSSTLARAWNERQAVELPVSITVDAVAPGLYDSNADLGSFTIPSGTIVSSHYLHFDTPGNAQAMIEGFLRFDAEIIGVIVRGDTSTFSRLDATDFLGVGTIYDDGLNLRGLETPNDRFSISADRRRIDFRFNVGEPGDRVRVLTVPAPFAGLLAPLALAGMRRRRA